MKTNHIVELSLVTTIALLLPMMIHQARGGLGSEHEHHGEGAATEMQTLTGEVIDLMCYIDHGATGEKHRQCAETCIKSGGPVGLLVGDKAYLVIGEHKPMNEKLAPLAAQTITLKGNVIERGGLRMIENAEIVNK